MDAWSEFHPLSEKDFPTAELKKVWNSIDHSITKYPDARPFDDPNRVGDAQSTVNHISEEEAVQLAKDIYELNGQVEDYMEDNPGGEGML